MRGTRSTGAFARYATHARNFGVAKNPEFTSADELGGEIFAAFIVGFMVGALIGAAFIVTWFQ